jgi:drug/metabolite transporter (DMT)-like permease
MRAGILFGLGAALSWGAADFLARYSARRIGAYRTLFYMQVVGVFSATLYLTVRQASAAALWHAAVAHAGLALFLGATSGIGMLSFYAALETGAVSLIAPIASSYPALTLLLAYWSGERITRLRFAGIILTLAGVIMASMGQAHVSGGERPAASHGGTRPVWLALVSALGFGVTYWALGLYAIPAWGGVGTVWIQRMSLLAWLSVAAVAMRRNLAPPRGVGWWLVGAIGVLDAFGFLLSNMGFEREQVGVVTVLGSLFGAVTLLLALVVLGERLSRRQWAGVALVFAGILLVNTPAG